MTPAPARHGLVAAAAATLLLLTACAPQDDAGTDHTDTTDQGSPSASDWEPGPLDEIMAKAMGYSLTDSDEEFTWQQSAVEQLVAACMSKEGFEYQPDARSVIDESPVELDVEWGSLEFAETYGYGITKDPWGVRDQRAQEETADPNRDYVEAMSGAERAAYEEALHGASADGSGEYDWATAGCFGAAQHEVYEGNGVSEDSEFTALQREIDNLGQAILDSPEWAALQADWASCMADAGFADQRTKEAAAEPISDRYEELNRDDRAVDKAKVDGLLKDEIALAVADWTCTDTVGFRDRELEINHAHQRAFVDQHATELDAWVEAAGEARA